MSAQGAQRVQVMLKGGGVYTDASDQACMDVLEKGDFYHGTQPGFDLANDFQKSEACHNCGTGFVKSLSVCPDCGADRNTGFQKSAGFTEPDSLQGVPQTHSHGPGLKRAKANPDFYAPDGLIVTD